METSAARYGCAKVSILSLRAAMRVRIFLDDEDWQQFLHFLRTYAKLSQLGVPTKTVLEHGEAATTTLGRFCVSPISIEL